jgi:imidazolonepropionase-like amidohydrolase
MNPLRWLLLGGSLLPGIVAVAQAAAESAAPPRPVAYLHGSLIDTTSGTVRPDAAIVTQGDRIVAVGSANDPLPEGAEIVDAGGRYVLPGMVNTHVHLASPPEPEQARAYLRRELYSGITTVRDMAGDVRLLAELKREALADEIPSPDIFYVALFAGPDFFADPRTHDSARGAVAGEVPWMRAITPQTDLPQVVAEARGTGATALKLYADLSASQVAAITQEAHRQHLLVWAHAAVFPAMPAEVVAAGVDVVSHACLLGYQATQATVSAYHGKIHVDARRALRPHSEVDEVLSAMRERGTILDATLFVYESGGPSSCDGPLSEQLGRRAHKAGVMMSAGTDDDADWDDPDSALDKELALLVSKAGFTPGEALRAATVTGARAAGQEGNAGSIEAGKLANFVILNANPLERIDNVRRVDVVIKHGIRYPRRDYRPARSEDFRKPT